MNKTWLTTLLSLSFVILVACQSENTDEHTDNANEQTEKNTEQVEQTDNDKIEKDTYERTEDGLEVTVDLEHNGNEVLRQITTTTADYEMIEAEDAEEAKQKFEDIEANDQFEEEKGIDYNLEFNENQFVETMDVNYQELDPERLAELTTPEDEESSDNVVKKVSYELTVEDLEESGFKKVE